MKSAVFRIGVFTVAGLVLTVLALVAAGGKWFVSQEQARMDFDSSVYGLQVGAPVVFRGVRLGQVVHVGLAPAAPGAIAVPVRVELDRALLLELLGESQPITESAVDRLVARGLVANLATQSLLTGQLYINLDLDLDLGRPPAPPAANVATPAPAAGATADGIVKIPTTRTRLQTLQAQLEQLDLAQLGRDLTAAAAAARQLVADPETQRLVQRTAAAATAMERLATRMEADWPLLAAQARATLASTERTVATAGEAATQVKELASAGQPALADLRATADEVQRSAAALRQTVSSDSELHRNAVRTLEEVAQAARALRTLADTLDQHPDALLRGRESAAP